MKKVLIFCISVMFGVQVYSQQILKLEDCRTMALEHNKGLKISENEIAIAEQKKKIAAIQNLPKFSAKGGYIHNGDNLSLLHETMYAPVGKFLPNGQWVPINAEGNPTANPKEMLTTILPKESFTIDISNIFIGSLSVVQPIYMGGKIRALNQMANLGKDIADAQHNNETSELIYSVDAAYWQVVSVSNKLRLAKQFEDLILHLQKDVTELEKEGLATKSDLLKINVKLNEARLNVTKAENGFSLSKMLLCQIVGLPMDTNFTLEDEVVKIEEHQEVSEVYAIKEAMQKRSDLKQLEILSNLSRTKIKLERSEFLPSVGFTANYLLSNPDLMNGFQKEFATTWNVGVVVNVPIFHWFERKHTLKVAKLEHEMVNYKLNEAKEKIELQVRQSAFKINEANKTLISTKENMNSAEENLRVAKEGYQEGVISLSNLMEAQTAWQAAYNELIEAGIDVKLSKVYLEKVVGNLR